jgi:hypothetical protein
MLALNNNSPNKSAKANTKRGGILKMYEISPCIEVFIDAFAVEFRSLYTLIPSPEERAYRRGTNKWHAFSPILPTFGIKEPLNAWVDQRAMYAVGGYTCKQPDRQSYRQNGFAIDLCKFHWTMGSHIIGNHEEHTREDAPEEEPNGK